MGRDMAASAQQIREQTGAHSSAAAPLLSVRDVTVRFGGIVALNGVSFDIKEGDIVGLIGPNGAGKTTLFNCMSRLYQPTEGDILFQGKSILKAPAHAIAGLGMGRTFQNVALFDRMSVLDNVKVGCMSASRAGFVRSAFKLGTGAEEARITERARELIAFMDLVPYALMPSGPLPFPIRKRVELARALASAPKLLLLDEPAAGLNHAEIETLKAQIRRVRDLQQVTVLLVEHHMSLVMSVSDQVVAINFGKKLAEGTPAEVQRNEDVVRAYLGTEAH
jgi:branched-chain amino acid transport system ATP-binding protein